MTKKTKDHQKTESLGFSSYSLSHSEIGLGELFTLFWKGKWTIFLTTMLFGIGALGLALSEPNVYQTQAKIAIVLDPFGFIEEKGDSSSIDIYGEASANYPLLTSSTLLKKISELSGQPQDALTGLKFAIERNGMISITKRSSEANESYESVNLYADFVNQAFKEIKLEMIQVSLNISMNLIDNNVPSIKAPLGVKAANQLYKQAYLMESGTRLVTLVQEPILPKKHKDPKRLLITIIGLLIGFTLGVLIIFIVSFVRDKSESN